MSEESKNTSAKSEKVNQNVPKETGGTPNKKKKAKKKKSLIPTPIEKGYLNSQQVYIPDEEKNKVKEPIAEVHQEDNLELQALPFRERQKAKRERLKKHMEGMTGQEKFLYLASYYKWKALITISVIIIAISISITIYNNKRPVALAYAILNCESPENINADFLDDYREQFGLTDGYRVTELTDIYLDKESFLQVAAQTSNSSYSEFPMMCYNGMYDIVISDEAGTVYCGMQEIVTPLEAYFPADIYSMIDKERIFETENYEGEVVPFAIDISDTEFAKSLNLSYDTVYLSFPGSTEANYKNSKRILEYILGIDVYQDDTTE